MPKLTPAQVRALFPATQRACYLNAAAASPIATPVNQAIVDHYREAMEWGDVGFEAWIKRKDEIRARFAKLIGAKDVRDVAFIGNTSMGFNLVAQLLKARGVREVVTLEGEFPSTTLPLLNHGLKLRVVRARPDGAYALEDVDAAIGPRTGAFVASAVQYSSGFVLDLGAARKLCRARKLLFAVNGAQSLGQVPLDVTASGIDFLCGTSHKWMMGGWGVSQIYVRRALIPKDGPLPLAGWLSVENPMAMDNLSGAGGSAGRRGSKRRTYFEAGPGGARFQRTASAFDIGNSPFGPVFGFGEALAIHEAVGVENTRKHNAALQKLLRTRLRERGFRPNAPDDPELSSGMCVFPVEGDAHAVVHELARKGVVVSPRGGGVRVATHIFNTAEDVDQLFWAMDKIGVRPA